MAQKFSSVASLSSQYQQDLSLEVARQRYHEAISLVRTCFAFLPNTKSIASMTFDLPLPLGPTTDEKHCNIQTSISTSRPPYYNRM